MDYIPIAIFWVLALFGLFGKRSILIYLFFATMPFASFAAIPTALTAGLTLTPTPIVACLLMGRTFLDAKAIRFAASAMSAPGGLLLLTLFWIVAIAVTLIMPRFFAGEVMVTPMKMTAYFHSESLVPTKQNISQIMYLSISVLTVVTFARLMLDPKRQQIALKALCWGGGIAIFTGSLDWLSHFVPLTPLLEPFRTANYALLTGDTVAGGVRRVVGLTPEASSFGNLCLQFLALIYFTRHAIEDDFIRRRVAPVLSGLLFFFTWLSTSSSAYVGLVVFAMFIGLEWLWRAKNTQKGTRKGRELELEFWLVFVLIGILFAVYLVLPHAFDPVVRLFDEMVLKKTKTSSFEERSFWNETSWNALLSTYGIGVGMGGTRASNAVIALLSNTGFAGGLLYYSFMLQTFLRRPFPGNANNTALVDGLRWSILPLYVADLLAGTSADFGLKYAFLFGTIYACVLISRHFRAEKRNPEPKAQPVRAYQGQV